MKLSAKSPNKYISVFQYLSRVLVAFVAASSALRVIFLAIDTYYDVFSYDTFMFDFLDKYSDLFTLTIFNFGFLVASILEDKLLFNLFVYATSLAFCAVVLYLSLMICRNKAKIAVNILIVLMIVELLNCLFAMTSYLFYIFAFIFRAGVLLCLIMSHRYININYEFY